MEYTKGEDIESQILRAIEEVLDFSDPKCIKASIILARIRTILGLKDLASAPDLYEALKLAAELLSIGISAEPQPIPLIIEKALAKAEGK